MQVHANVEPATQEVKLTEMEIPVQMVWLSGAVVTCGVGLTVTVTFWLGPVHPFATGVITYVTVSTVVPEFIKV